MSEQLWFYWIQPKRGFSVIGPSAALPFMPFFRSMCVMRNGNGNPQLLVGSKTRWCTPSQNLYNYRQMISRMEHQKPMWNEYKALRNMSHYPCVDMSKKKKKTCPTSVSCVPRDTHSFVAQRPQTRVGEVSLPC
jgi:hypothetical protein